MSLLRAIFEDGGHRGRVDHRQALPVQRRRRGTGHRTAGADLDQLYALVDLMPDRWKAFLLLKTFASLCWGEVTAAGDVRENGS
jgi:hypothetical protein